MRLPCSIFVSVSLFTAETTAALYLSSTYSSAGDQIWQGLTLLFTLVPSVLVQLTLTFIHRDLSRDRPLILLLHILQLGPIVRCLEAFCIYGSVGRVEEPYVSITRKKQMPRGGQSEEVERQVGQAEGKLFTHRAAFARTSVIQAFLGSAPQLTLQLYICVLQQGVSIGRDSTQHKSITPPGFFSGPLKQHFCIEAVDSQTTTLTLKWCFSCLWGDISLNINICQRFSSSQLLHCSWCLQKHRLDGVRTDGCSCHSATANTLTTQYMVRFSHLTVQLPSVAVSQ